MSAGRKLVLRFFAIEIEYISKSCSESHNFCYLQYSIEIFEKDREAVQMGKIMPEIAERRSVRKYKDIDVSNADIELLIEAARLAPSGSNTQPGRYMFITKDGR